MPLFQYQNIDVHYSIIGEGKSVVLIHGFGEDSSIWDEQVQFLKSHCQLITLDLPGSGKTGIMKSETASIDDYAEVVHALCIELNLQDLILLGHSMGGYITLAFAEKYAEKIKGFGLIHSTAFADTEEKKQTRKKGIEFIQKNGAYSFLRTSTPNLFSATSKQRSPEIIDSLIEKGNEFTQQSLVQYYEAMIQRPDRTAVLSGSEKPVLFILGTEDPAAPITDMLKQVHLPQTAYIHILENVGHMSMLEAPELLNQYVLQFINEV
jgi:pimeloyl-ACP methyl ester carboxylesterase